MALRGRFADVGMWPAVPIYTAIPTIAWRYCRTVNEFLIGVPLLIFCGYISMGGACGFWDQLQHRLYAAVVIAIGIVEHRPFQALAAKLRVQQAWYDSGSYSATYARPHPFPAAAPATGSTALIRTEVAR